MFGLSEAGPAGGSRRDSAQSPMVLGLDMVSLVERLGL